MLTDKKPIAVRAEMNSHIAVLSSDALALIDLDLPKCFLLPFTGPEGDGMPSVTLSEELDVLIVSSSSGLVSAYGLSSRKLLWRYQHLSFVTTLILMRSPDSVVVEGDEVAVLSLQNGRKISSPLTSHHSHVDACGSCLCKKNRSTDTYRFKDGKAVLLGGFQGAIKEAVVTPKFIAIAKFDSPRLISFINPTSGSEIKSDFIPECVLLDVMAYDSAGDALWVIAHNAVSRRIEIWQAFLGKAPEIVSMLPEGIGCVGWSFCRQRKQMVSPMGLLADVASGQLVKRDWADWKIDKESFDASDCES